MGSRNCRVEGDSVRPGWIQGLRCSVVHSHPLTFSELRFLQSPWLSAAPGTRYPLSSPRKREPFFQMIRLTQVKILWLKLGWR